MAERRHCFDGVAVGYRPHLCACGDARRRNLPQVLENLNLVAANKTNNEYSSY
jgi:hypothetical protein